MKAATAPGPSSVAGSGAAAVQACRWVRGPAPRSARTPPGFMKAATAPCSSSVAASWASAVTLPSEDSPLTAPNSVTSAPGGPGVGGGGGVAGAGPAPDRGQQPPLPPGELGGRGAPDLCGDRPEGLPVA